MALVFCSIIYAVKQKNRSIKIKCCLAFPASPSIPENKASIYVNGPLDDEEIQSPVDILFQHLEEKDPDHFAVKQYRKFKMAAGVICSK